MAARLLGDKFRFCSGVFSTVQRTNQVNATVRCTIGFVLEEWTDVRQLAARPAVDALPFATLRDGQHGRKGPSDSGTPGVRLSVDHAKEHTPTAWKCQA